MVQIMKVYMESEIWEILYSYNVFKKYFLLW